MSLDASSREFLKKALRFALTGLLVTAVHITIAVFFIEAIALAPALANGLAFTAATAISYLLNTMWSFSEEIQGKYIVRFSTVSCVGLFLSMSISGFAESHGFPYSYGIFGVVCTVPPVTFLLHNYWTYR